MQVCKQVMEVSNQEEIQVQCHVLGDLGTKSCPTCIDYQILANLPIKLHVLQPAFEWRTYMTGGFPVGFPRAASSSGWEMVALSIMVVAMAAAHFSSAQTHSRRVS